VGTVWSQDCEGVPTVYVIGVPVELLSVRLWEPPAATETGFWLIENDVPPPPPPPPPVVKLTLTVCVSVPPPGVVFVIVNGTFVQPAGVRAQFDATRETSSCAEVVPEVGVTLYQEAPPVTEKVSALPSLLPTVICDDWVADVNPTEVELTVSDGAA
jgi:hypothetical protein